MPNANYQKGARLEYATKKKWEERGYFVVRSAGSHGKADLVAIKLQTSIGPGPVVFLIQCKAYDKPNVNEKNELKLLAGELNVEACYVYKDGRKTIEEIL